MSALLLSLLFFLSPVAVLAVAVVLEETGALGAVSSDDLFARTMARVLEAEAVDVNAVDVSDMSRPVRPRPVTVPRIAA